MTTDWIVIGGGIAGAALGYELTRKGFSVRLIEQHSTSQNATRYSYGGLAYWSGTTELTRQLCEEGIKCHRHLSAELGADTQFREIDLLMTIPSDRDPVPIFKSYSRFAIPPRLLSPQDACEIEPLLNPSALSGVLAVRHGHIEPELTAAAYIRAMQRLGGTLEIDSVVSLIQDNQRITGVKTSAKTYQAGNVVVCAGGLSRQLLKAAGLSPKVYFTHAELIEIPTTDVKLQTLVMAAEIQRFQLETTTSKPEADGLWDEAGKELFPPILDPGAIQFQDGRIRIGQISRAIADPNAQINRDKSEKDLRSHIGKILPCLETLPGTWHHCLVAFGQNGLPSVGAIKPLEGIYIFSGFTNPLVFVPPLAKRFANWVGGESDQIIPHLSI